jgi:aldose 1-epimerase
MNTKSLPKFETSSFGTTSKGESIDHYLIQNANGLSLGVMEYGATVTKLIFQGKDLVLGFHHLHEYEQSFDLPAPPYFGAVVGRVAGRIKNAKASLQNREISLTKNHGIHHLHGGFEGWSRHKWIVSIVRETEEPYITFRLIDSENTEGYPGNVHAQITYKLTQQNELIVHFQATSSELTWLNPTQHMYFNLHGNGGEVYSHQLVSEASTYLELQPDGIPTGRILPIEGSSLHSIRDGKFPKGLDHTFPTQSNQVLQVFSPMSGIKMSVKTSAPAMHLYVGGNCFGQIQGKYGHEYTQESGFCVETQSYPDAPNQSNFPTILLDAGETFEQVTYYKFDTI